MKKYIISIVIACSIVSQALATTQPFDFLGQYSDRFVDGARCSLEDATAMLYGRYLENLRFNATVAYEGDLETPDLDLFPATAGLRGQGVDGRLFGFGKPSKLPVTHASLLLQRLWRAPDGINLDATPVAKDDPLTASHHIIIPALIKFLSGRDPAQVFDADEADRFSFVLYTLLYREVADDDRARNKKRGQKKWKAIHDLVVTALRAVDDARVNPIVYHENFVQNTLLAFEIYKASTDPDPISRMTELFISLGDMVDPAKESAPFTIEEYEASIMTLAEWTYTTLDEIEGAPLSNRQLLCYMLGRRKLASPLPLLHYTGNATVGASSFSTCGEVSLLNVFNHLTADYRTPEKSLSPELLEIVARLNPALAAFLGANNTVELQRPNAIMEAWVNLVSGFDVAAHPGLHYKHVADRCEIIGGTDSMLAVVRALLPDDDFRAIDAAHEMPAQDRMIATLNHLVALFSSENEDFSWRVLNEQQEQVENDQIDARKCKIAFYKKARGEVESPNIPIISGEAMEDDNPLFIWDMEPGHYVLTSAADADDEVFRKLGIALTCPRISREGMTTTALDSWSMADSDIFYYLDFVVKGEAGVPVDFGFVVPERVHETIIKVLPYAKRFDHGLLLLSTAMIHGHQIEEFYLMAANLISCLPEGDPHTAMLMAKEFVDDEGVFTPPEKVHPRFRSKLDAVLGRVAVDPEFAFSCLKEANLIKLYKFFKRYVHELPIDKVTVAIASMIEDAESELDLVIFSTLMADFGAVLPRIEGIVDLDKLAELPIFVGKHPAEYYLEQCEDNFGIKGLLDNGIITQADLARPRGHDCNFYGKAYFMRKDLNLLREFGVTAERIGNKSGVIHDLLTVNAEEFEVLWNILQFTREMFLSVQPIIPQSDEGIVRFTVMKDRLGVTDEDLAPHFGAAAAE